MEERLDVLVDVNETLVYPGGEILGAYRLAHGTVEFLLALDRIGARLGLYSCGKASRSRALADELLREIESRGYRLGQDLELFSAGGGIFGKKPLEGLRPGLDLDRAILVDDLGRNAASGEERNLLKLYGTLPKRWKASPLYRARLANNLVRALGMILRSLEESSSPVEALDGLQRGDEGYRHEASNAEEIYQRGLLAMQDVNPHFCLAQDQVLPWSSPQEEDGQIFQANSKFQSFFGTDN